VAALGGKLNTYNNLYIFGDSYSTTNYCVDYKDSFWYSIAKDTDIQNITNYSWLGNSLDSITHTLISEQNKFDWDSLFVICLPVLERITVFDDFQGQTRQATRIADSIEEFTVQSHSSLDVISLHESEYKHIIMNNTRSWTEITALRNLFLIDQWLSAKGVDYIFLNMSQGFMTDSAWPTSTFLIEYFKKHNNSIIFENTYTDINQDIHKPVDFDKYGWMGHHGKDGNQHYYKNSVKPKLIELGIL